MCRPGGDRESSWQQVSGEVADGEHMRVCCQAENDDKGILLHLRPVRVGQRVDLIKVVVPSFARSVVCVRA